LGDTLAGGSGTLLSIVHDGVQNARTSAEAGAEKPAMSAKTKPPRSTRKFRVAYLKKGIIEVSGIMTKLRHIVRCNQNTIR